MSIIQRAKDRFLMEKVLRHIRKHPTLTEGIVNTGDIQGIAVQASQAHGKLVYTVRESGVSNRSIGTITDGVIALSN